MVDLGQARRLQSVHSKERTALFPTASSDQKPGRRFCHVLKLLLVFLVEHDAANQLGRRRNWPLPRSVKPVDKVRR